MASRTAPSDPLAAWLARQRWFASKTRRIVAVEREDRIPIGSAAIDVLAVTLDDGVTDRYAVPLAGAALPVDALDDPAFARALLALVDAGGRARGERGGLTSLRTPAFPRDLAGDLSAQRLIGEQSNTSIVFDRALIMKFFRRLTPGTNPDLEITRFLTERTRFRHTPRLAGALEYTAPDLEPTTLAVIQELVVDARDGWRWLLDALGRREAALSDLRRLGERTAGLHLALATPTDDPAFAAEPIAAADLDTWAADVVRQVESARAALADRVLPEVASARAGLAGLLGRLKLRHHGDYHLGQTLRVDATADFMIIDFEGEPLRPMAERRRKHTPLRDVAGLLRSLAYAAATAARDGDAQWTAAWEPAARAAFLAGYREAAGDAPFLPSLAGGFDAAVAVFEVEKAAYEIVYEANNRPDWIEIPVGGLVRASASLRLPHAPAGAA
ncbi:MAG TPA: sugar phosphotransferase [Methylomirabilota bacterium]|jgi:predicted trehalose synthase|nr:sugar phosphotransferase [Methylomirabilota bacterium]HEV8617818.1 sugar phosphotransferase [Methylomirabilota bacterium]